MPDNRSPRQARGTKKPKKPLFKLDINLGLDFDLDFDADDFDIIDARKPPKPRGKKQANARILRPRLDVKDLTVRAAYENAEAFARQIDLTPGARLFAWLSGSFIFGDIVEALITPPRVGISAFIFARCP